MRCYIWFLSFVCFTSFFSIQAEPTGKVIFIAGKKSHGPGEHEYEAGLRYLQSSLTNLSSIPLQQTVLFTNGWPENSELLQGAATIVLYSDGSDHRPEDHPLLHGDRLKFLSKLMEQGTGLVAIHYTVFVPTENGGKEFLDWIGGYFDYESGNGPNKWYSSIENRTFSLRPIADHPICRGIQPWEMKEELYFKIRFPEAKRGWTPLIGFAPEEQVPEHIVAWALERPNKGRGFGYTGGHYFKNFENPNERKLLLNAILWTARLEVPKRGAD